ncbi:MULTISPECIES: DUF1700 domain-containing protein [Furfurilactobacillus]|uniref:DUF1700 domain-containing protein n=1 Tax=Furfurilactobacillus milii TaxID=2888272 RepID=A0A6N9I2A7_9LACO|nr:DUF1700 domain-containing protein [Furfurilactobacillus milii]MYV16927.1 DUF1700 domain-containing protein [Furfurilactobacillus milii]
MTTDAYLKELQRRLHGLSDSERSDVMDFYTEYVEDANLTSGDAIVSKLGTPKQLARKVLADYSIKENETAEQKGERRTPRSNANMVWMIILAILSTPVTIPAAIAIVAVLFAVVVVMVALIGSGIVVAVALVGGAIAVAGVSLYTGAYMVFTNFFVGIAYLGVGLTGVGVILILIPLCYYIIRFLIQISANFIRFLYRKFSNRRQQPKGDH